VFDVVDRLLPDGRPGDYLSLALTLAIDLPLCWLLHIRVEKPLIALGRRLTAQSTETHSLIQRLEISAPSQRDTTIVATVLADEVHERECLCHQAMNAEHQGDTRDGHCPQRSQGSRQNYKGGPRHAGSTLGRQEQHRENNELMREIQRRIRRLREKHHDSREIQASSIEVERIPGGNHQSTTDSSQPSSRNLSMSRGSTVSVEVVAAT